MPTEKTWQQWLERLYNLRRDKRGSHERPHKPAFLLAVLDLLDRRVLTRNEVPLSPELVSTFKRYFEVVRHRDDQPKIEAPYYHLSMMDAAHLIPFRVSHNDKPDNGLALCPNHHRAMDEFLIAPCPHPEFKAGVWRVSPRVDERRDSRRDLIGLSGKAVLEPGERKFYPAVESLRWRERHLEVKY